MSKNALAVYDVIKFGVELETIFVIPVNGRSHMPKHSMQARTHIASILTARMKAIDEGSGVYFQPCLSHEAVGEDQFQTDLSDPNRWCVDTDGSLYTDGLSYRRLQAGIPKHAAVSMLAGQTQLLPLEVISPVTSIRDIVKIARISHDVLSAPGLFDAQHNKYTSHHVHMSHPSFLDPAALDRICAAWAVFEPAFFKLVAPWRSSVEGYSAPWRSWLTLEGLYKKPYDYLTIAGIVNAFTGGEKYMSLNLSNLNQHRRTQTIECRIKHGSVDARELSAWVVLLATFFARCITLPRLGGLKQASCSKLWDDPDVALWFLFNNFLRVPALSTYWSHKAFGHVKQRFIATPCGSKASLQDDAVLCDVVRSAIRLRGSAGGVQRGEYNKRVISANRKSEHTAQERIELTEAAIVVAGPSRRKQRDPSTPLWPQPTPPMQPRSHGSGRTTSLPPPATAPSSTARNVGSAGHAAASGTRTATPPPGTRSAASRPRHVGRTGNANLRTATLPM